MPRPATHSRRRVCRLAFEQDCRSYCAPFKATTTSGTGTGAATRAAATGMEDRARLRWTCGFGLACFYWVLLTDLNLYWNIAFRYAWFPKTEKERKIRPVELLYGVWASGVDIFFSTLHVFFHIRQRAHCCQEKVLFLMHRQPVNNITLLKLSVPRC